MASKGVLRIKIAGDASDFTRTMQGAIGKFGKFGAAAVKAGALAAGAFAAVSVKAFAGFDQAMTESLAIMGDVSDEMRKGMSDAAREVAKTTKFSAAEAAESYFFLASAGLDAAESIEALPKVAAFAQAGAFDMATATDLLTDAQSALGLAVDDSAQSMRNMSRVGDVLVKANTLANASVEQFSEALTNKAGAALRNLNKDMEEGVAVLAVFADQGVKGSEAGVALNATLEGLTRTARTNAGAYETLGVKVFDAEGEMRNMADIIGDLETATTDMSTEQRDAALAQLGLTRTARDGIVQLLGSADAVREYEGALRDAAGTTEDVASKQMESFSAQMGLIKDRLMDVAITVGGFLAPKILTAFDTMSGAWDVFTAELSGNRAEARVQRATGQMTGVGEVAVVLARTYEKVKERITTAVEAVRQWWDDNGPAIRAAVRDVAEAVVTWWDETAKPKIEDFRDALSDFWHNTAKRVLRELKEAWTENKDTLAEAWTNMGRILDELGTLVGVIFSDAESDVQDGTAGMADDLGTLAESIAEISDALADALEWFNRNLETWRTIAGPIQFLTGWLNRVMTPLTEIREALRDIDRLMNGLGNKSSGKGSFGRSALVPSGIVGLADGALVTSPTLAVVGEGGESEVVLPLSKLSQMVGGGLTVHVNMSNYLGNESDVVDRIVRGIAERTRRGGTLVANVSRQ